MKRSKLKPGDYVFVDYENEIGEVAEITKDAIIVIMPDGAYIECAFEQVHKRMRVC